MSPIDRLGTVDCWVDRILDDELKRWLRARIDSGPMSIRAIVVLRDLDVCWLCNNHVLFRHLSMDHVIPRSHGGSNGAENLRVAHDVCNSRRSNNNCPRCVSDPHVCHVFISSRVVPKTKLLLPTEEKKASL